MNGLWQCIRCHLWWPPRFFYQHACGETEGYFFPGGVRLDKEKKSVRGSRALVGPT